MKQKAPQARFIKQNVPHNHCTPLTYPRQKANTTVEQLRKVTVSRCSSEFKKKDFIKE